MPDAPLPPLSPAPKTGPSDLRLRVIYASLGATGLLGCVWFSPWTFGLLFAAVQAVMLWEFYRMMRAGGYAPATWIGVGAGVWLFAALFLKFYIEYGGSNSNFDTSGAAVGSVAVSPGWHTVMYPSGMFAWVLLPLLLLPILLIIREMMVWPKYARPFSNIGATIVGLLYISLPMGLLVSIAVSPASAYDPRRVFALMFLVWASDIGAYAAGKTFGKHKMAPKISPGKTWEGWAGGFVLTLLIGWALGVFLPDLPLAHRLVAAGVVAVFAPLGDLAESMLKRSVGVKDSGRIMPGHGGLLDRFDAFLLVLPVLALLQLLAG